MSAHFGHSYTDQTGLLHHGDQVIDRTRPSGFVFYHANRHRKTDMNDCNIHYGWHIARASLEYIYAFANLYIVLFADEYFDIATIVAGIILSLQCFWHIGIVIYKAIHPTPDVSSYERADPYFMQIPRWRKVPTIVKIVYMLSIASSWSIEKTFMDEELISTKRAIAQSMEINDATTVENSSQ
jgi:hypothetical protein